MARRVTCNHSYTADPQGKPRSTGKRCPYPEFYEKACSTVSSVPEVGPVPALPVDDHGACIFHSHEIPWKWNNDFKANFLQLVQLIDADESEQYYDFSEFVFAGNERRTTNGIEHHVLHIADATFRKRADFTGASFLDALELDAVTLWSGYTFAKQSSLTTCELGMPAFMASTSVARRSRGWPSSPRLNL